MKKNISIVVVTYNSSPYIGKLLESIYNSQNYIDEVIIIENDSPDKDVTRETCRSYSKKIKIKYVRNKNVGFGNSCNLGAQLSTSSHVLFLNPDTELKNDSIKILFDHMHKNNAQIIGGKALTYSGRIHGSVVRAPGLYIGLFEFTNLGKLFKQKNAHNRFYYEDFNIQSTSDDVEVDIVSGAYLLISKSDFQTLNGFDQNIFMYLEDVDLCVRAKNRGMKVMYCPHSTINHVGGASSKNKYKIRHQAWFDSRKYYYKKHFNMLINMIIQPIFTIEEFLLKKIKKI